MSSMIDQQTRKREMWIEVQYLQYLVMLQLVARLEHGRSWLEQRVGALEGQVFVNFV